MLPVSVGRWGLVPDRFPQTRWVQSRLGFTTPAQSGESWETFQVYSNGLRSALPVGNSRLAVQVTQATILSQRCAVHLGHYAARDHAGSCWHGPQKLHSVSIDSGTRLCYTDSIINRSVRFTRPRREGGQERSSSSSEDSRGCFTASAPYLPQVYNLIGQGTIMIALQTHDVLSHCTSNHICQLQTILAA